MNKVAYLGIPGSYSYIATLNYFGKNTNFIGKKSFKDLFKVVFDADIEACVIPVENSTTGSIIENYDLLLKYKLSIKGEVILQIHHHLLGISNIDLNKQKTVCYSHPQVLSQCESFLVAYPELNPVPVTDSATAAKLVSKNNKTNQVAIASRQAARIYDLSILKENIEDQKNNYTRFAIVSRKGNTTGNKMSLVFSVKHIPGSLVAALMPFARRGLNLIKIESRPVFGKPWEYIFFLDLEIGEKTIAMQDALRELKEVTNFLTILGQYKKGIIYET